MLQDEETCLRRSWASTENTQEALGPWSPGPPCLNIHPYLDWLLHTLVEEVEGTGPLHPEGKKGRDLHMVKLGGNGKGFRLGLGQEADERGADLGGGEVDLEMRAFTLGQGLIWDWRTVG